MRIRRAIEVKGGEPARELRQTLAARDCEGPNLVPLKHLAARTAAAHLHYIAREGVSPDGEPAQAYDQLSDGVDLSEFDRRCQDDRHQFRFIVSPQDAVEIGDLKAFARDLLGRMEVDLGTPLAVASPRMRACRGISEARVSST